MTTFLFAIILLGGVLFGLQIRALVFFPSFVDSRAYNLTKANLRQVFMARWRSILQSSYSRAVMAILLVLSGYLLLSSYFFHNHSQKMYEFRKEELHRLVTVGLNLIQPIRDDYAAGKISREEALTQSGDLIRRMTYQYGRDENYLFMSSYSGIMLVQPFQPALQGTSQWDLRDENGVYIVRELVATASSPAQAGYVTYHYPPPNSTIPEEKVAYVVGIPEWEAFIGTGMYMTDIQAGNKGYLTNSLISALILFSVIVTIIFFTLRPVATSYRSMVQVFDKVQKTPDHIPSVHPYQFRTGSEEWRLMTGFQSMLTQIRGHKQQLQEALAALQNSEARFRGVFEGAAMGIAVRDREGKLLESNHALHLMLGYTRQEYKNLAYADYTHPEDKSNADRLFEETGRGEREFFRVEKRFVRKDGQELWGRVTGSLVRDADKNPQYVIVMLEDVTERVVAYQMLEQRVEERTHELSTLLEITQQVNSTLELESLLSVVLEQLKKVVDYSGTGIFTRKSDDRLRLLIYQGPIPQHEIRYDWRLDQDRVNAAVIQLRKPVIIDDIQGDSPLAHHYRASAGGMKLTHRSWMGVPLIVRDQVIGMISFDHDEPYYYTGHHAELAFAFANQVATAIENSRLYEEAKQLAVLRERQRLARELHDAVTQTLFSANLIAEVLPRVWQRSPEEGAKRLAQIHQLTRGALAEMRTLLFELRPGALTDVPLPDLLRQLSDAITGRTGIEVALSIKGVIQMPPQVKIAFYRVAQEALNNLVKHADATVAQVSLLADQHTARLTVQDNGKGFDTTQIPPDHFGVQIMAERAREICAKWELTSELGLGTCVTLEWKEQMGVTEHG